MSEDSKALGGKKIYSCSFCKKETTTLSLGLINRCCWCGKQGFSQYRNSDTEMLNEFLITGK